MGSASLKCEHSRAFRAFDENRGGVYCVACDLEKGETLARMVAAEVKKMLEPLCFCGCGLIPSMALTKLVVEFMDGERVRPSFRSRECVRAWLTSFGGARLVDRAVAQTVGGG